MSSLNGCPYQSYVWFEIEIELHKNLLLPATYQTISFIQWLFLLTYLIKNCAMNSMTHQYPFRQGGL